MIDYHTGDHRAVLTVSEPERMNPLTTVTMRELEHAVRQASADESVRAIVITGAGDRAFSAGGDLSAGFMDRPLEQHRDRGALADLFRALRAARTPSIARVNGHALGGGFGLAAACDVVVAVEDARFGMPEIDVGLWPMMITAVLQPAVPQKALLELMLTGRRISAEEARQLGIVSQVVGRDRLDAAVDDVVEAIAARSPTTIALGKRAFYQAAGMDFDSALDHLHVGLTAVGMTDDAAEGVEAFVEKRPPRWGSTH